MALDYGDARTGVAISDERGILCGETLVIAEWNEERLVNRIAALAADKGCALVLLGLPLNMDGSAGPQAQKVMDFGAVLEKAGLKVHYQDERLTTVTAEAVLIDSGVRREDRRRHVDKLAATVILEQWLASQGRRKEE